MNPLIRARLAIGCHPQTADAAVGIALYVTVLVTAVIRTGNGMESMSPSEAAVGGVVFLVLAFRRRWPHAVLIATVAGHFAWLALTVSRSPLTIASVIALYTVASRDPRRIAWAWGAITAGTLAGAGVLFSHESWLSPEVLGQVAWAGMLTAVGDAVRIRRAYVTAIEERVFRAERTRDDEARRRVVEERLRIARELHDVLAHHIALINVQAQVAAHVMETQPEQAREALGHIRLAGRAALDELRTTVGLLRQPDSPEEFATEPAPSLERLPELISSFTAAGLKVECHVEGTVRELPTAVDLSAYRVIQEALTNVRKHAGQATATARITYGEAELDVEVVDDGPGAGDTAGVHAGTGTGHGLIGMRERAHSVGGSFAAGPLPGAGFRVRAVLPITGGTAQ